MVSGVAFLENGCDFWARLCEFLVGDRTRVVNDLGTKLLATCRIAAGCITTAWAYKFLAQDTRRFLDFRAHGIEVLANVGSVLIWRFVKEDALNIDAVALVGFRPAGVDRHIFQNLFNRSFAVIYPHIADCSHIAPGIEQRQLAGVICIGRRRLARAAVRVDDNNEMQVRVIVDAGSGGSLC
jgi:hypothetical protein